MDMRQYHSLQHLQHQFDFQHEQLNIHIAPTLLELYRAPYSSSLRYLSIMQPLFVGLEVIRNNVRLVFLLSKHSYLTSLHNQILII